MDKILIVEDDKALSNGILLALKSEKYSLIQAFCLKEARRLIQIEKPALIILDLNLPDGNGLDFLKEIRTMTETRVLILTANDMETDIVMGLELGADDYITKPFSLMVLRARVNTQLRRDYKREEDNYQIHDLYFNFNTMVFRKGEQTIELSKTEQKLLRILIENRKNIVSRNNLIDKVWSSIEYVDENALSVAIKRLRDKIEENSSAPSYIKTIYGIGYSWVEDKNDN